MKHGPWFALVVAAIVGVPAGERQAGGEDGSSRKEALHLGEVHMIKEVSPKECQNTKVARLCWSRDDGEIYLTGYSRESSKEVTFRHFILNADGSDFREIDQSPAWAEEYWDWKHPLVAPDGSAELKERRTSVTAASSRSLGGYQGSIPVVNVSFGGERLREFKGEENLKGFWYGWAPKGTDVHLYANQKGHLCAISYDGKDQATLVKGHYTLPAWSNKADRVAFVATKSGGKCWRIYTAPVN